PRFLAHRRAVQARATPDGRARAWRLMQPVQLPWRVPGRSRHLTANGGRRTAQSPLPGGEGTALEPLLREERAQVAHAAGVAPLVVVPGDHLDHVAADDHRAQAVDDRAVGIALEVAADERLFGVLYVATHPTAGGFA